MIKTNIVVTKNQKETIRKVAEVFSSKESENDSPKSLHILQHRYGLFGCYERNIHETIKRII
ncbi:hypothetical protein [Labilibacter marinus]|uniref:hypothetical protein n=1 Tax=Labilibacter marinus TaxID=1477105 RepID=UPI00094F7A60|nr:hypothetical protein [Labilibacter marinus]